MSPQGSRGGGGGDTRPRGGGVGRGGKKNKSRPKNYKNIRVSKNQIVVPSENVVFGISKELDLKSDPQIFLE